MLCDPMEAFYNFCVGSDKYRVLMGDDLDDTPEEGRLLDDAVIEFRADYDGAAQTLTIEGMEEVGE